MRYFSSNDLRKRLAKIPSPFLKGARRNRWLAWCWAPSRRRSWPFGRRTPRRLCRRHKWSKAQPSCSWLKGLGSSLRIPGKTIRISCCPSHTRQLCPHCCGSVTIPSPVTKTLELKTSFANQDTSTTVIWWRGCTAVVFGCIFVCNKLSNQVVFLFTAWFPI